MQAPTHFLTGVLLERSIEQKKSSLLLKAYIAIIGIISHGILDKLARVTYHPPNPLIKDWFWVIYHITIGVFSIFILRRYWSKYKFGIACASLPDLEWLVLHSSNALGIQTLFWKRPIVHETIHYFLDFFFPFQLLNSLPDWTLERKGAIFEFGLVTILYYFASNLSLVMGQIKRLNGRE